MKNVLARKCYRELANLLWYVVEDSCRSENPHVEVPSGPISVPASHVSANCGIYVTNNKKKKNLACLLCLATHSLKTSSYFLCCASFGVPDHSGNYAAQMQPYGWRTAEGGCLKEKKQKVKTSVSFSFSCSQPEKVFFTLHIVHK